MAMPISVFKSAKTDGRNGKADGKNGKTDVRFQQSKVKESIYNIYSAPDGSRDKFYLTTCIKCDL